MTTLGTPLSPSATKVMLLGSGELGKEVLIALQRLGVETIAVDRYENAPGQQVAHHARTITMRRRRATEGSDRGRSARPRWCPRSRPSPPRCWRRLEAAGVVRVIPTARAARLTMDREGIRRLAAETLALPTSPYKFCDSLEELQAAIDGGIGYPCVVKPVMSSSGKGQSKIDGPEGVKAAWDYAMAGGRVSHGRVIVEGFIDFDYEITPLTVRGPGCRWPGGNAILRADRPCAGQRRLCGKLAAPPDAPEGAGHRAAHRPRGDGRPGRPGLFGVELFVKGEQVWFSEVSPRPHDTGMVTMITQWQNEFELHARAILGLPVSTALKSPGASAVIYGGVEAQGIVFDGVDDALRVPQTELRLFGKPESFEAPPAGVALAYAENVDVAPRARQGRGQPRQAAQGLKPSGLDPV